MNINIILKRMFFKSTLIIGSNSSLASSARVLNARNSSSFINVGNYSRIEGELFVFGHGGSIQIGNWCFVGSGTRIWSSCQIQIGHRVLISHNCNIMDSLTHPINPASRHSQFKSILTKGHPSSLSLDERPVCIGNDVWIGAGATVLRGVCIGDAAIIGAGSVVTKDIPANTIAVGNPARVIRHLNERELDV